MSLLKFEPSLAHFIRQLAEAGDPLPQAFHPDLILKVLLGLAVDLLMILDKVHNNFLI